MRLLFDEQLSARLCSMLAEIYPDSLHVEKIGLSGASDEAVRGVAAERAEVAHLLRERREDILRFGNQDDVAFLALG